MFFANISHFSVLRFIFHALKASRMLFKIMLEVYFSVKSDMVTGKSKSVFLLLFNRVIFISRINIEILKIFPEYPI